MRENLYRARKKLKSMTTACCCFSVEKKIFINESLTSKHNGLFKDYLKLKKTTAASSCGIMLERSSWVGILTLLCYLSTLLLTSHSLKRYALLKLACFVIGVLVTSLIWLLQLSIQLCLIASTRYNFYFQHSSPYYFRYWPSYAPWLEF